MKKNFSVAIAGGGSTYTPDMLEMLCLVREDFPLRKVVLYDIDADRQEHIGKFGEILFREYYPEAEFSYTTDPQKAFEDIDFVLVQIRAGGLKMRELDEKIPLKYGVIGQETCGPGGFAYGMRSVPAMIELVKPSGAILLKHGYLIIPIRLRSWQRQLNGYFRMIIV